MINTLSLISPNKSTESFSLEKIINSSCTSSFCGNEPVPQMVYHCLICDPKKKYSFCQFCYESCHNKCRSFNYFPSNSSFLQIKERNKTSETTAMITITKTIMGTTIIALPNFMFKMGMGLGSVLLIVNGIIGVLVIGVLLRCKDITKKL